jgi:DNA-binding transcriptional regulator YiaG
LIYTLDTEINLLELNPSYPQQPQTLGERIRKARMDKGLLIRELAQLIGVSEDTVINWEVRGIKPEGQSMERVREFIEK